MGRLHGGGRPRATRPRGHGVRSRCRAGRSGAPCRAFGPASRQWPAPAAWRLRGDAARAVVRAAHEPAVADDALGRDVLVANPQVSLEADAARPVGAFEILQLDCRRGALLAKRGGLGPEVLDLRVAAFGCIPQLAAQCVVLAAQRAVVGFETVEPFDLSVFAEIRSTSRRRSSSPRAPSCGP